MAGSQTSLKGAVPADLKADAGRTGRQILDDVGGGDDLGFRDQVRCASRSCLGGVQQSPGCGEWYTSGGLFDLVTAPMGFLDII